MVHAKMFGVKSDYIRTFIGMFIIINQAFPKIRICMDGSADGRIRNFGCNSH
jgi:hypothetical protein